MGVTGLLGLLKSIQKPTHLRDFSGKTLGIDAYGWLHRGAVACAIELATDKPTTKFVDFAMHRVRMLFHFGVTPYLIFDGDRLPSKAATESERATRRQQARKTGEELLRMGKVSQAYDAYKKAVDVTPEMARQLIEELKKFQVQYVVAPFEADSQMVYLEKQGVIDGIISEDSDLLVFGAKTLLTKLDQYGECVKVRQEDFTACRDVSFASLTLEHFRRMAILSGCDYLNGIPQMGLRTAHRLVRKFRTAPNPVERIIQCAQLEGKFQVPQDYLSHFQQAEKTFLYQWVFCPTTGGLVNLCPLPKDVKLEDMPFIGAYVEPDVAKLVANGHLNPMTKKAIVVRSMRPAGRENRRISPLKPKVATEGKTTIEKFFKATRTPLAELDVNTLTPSPSQRNVLERNLGRTWPASPAPSQVSASEPRPAARSHDSSGTLRRTVSSAPQAHPPKRQRMCLEDSPSSPGNAEEKTSRFFGGADPSPSIGPGRKTKTSKLDEVQIWSDDSLEEAMAELPEVKPSLLRAKSDFGPSRKFNIFMDGNKATKSSEEALTQPVVTPPSTVLPKRKPVEDKSLRQSAFSKFTLLEPKLSVPSSELQDRDAEGKRTSSDAPLEHITVSDDVVEQSTESVFHTSLMAETRSLGNRFGFATRTDEQAKKTAPLEEVVEPLTPPPTSENDMTSVSIVAGPSSVVKETPKRPLDHTGEATQETHKVTNIPAFLPHVIKVKGSEDLLIVPDSDESDRGSLSPTNSPPSSRVVKEDKTERPSFKMTNLRQFMFENA